MSAATNQSAWELFEVGPYGNLCPAKDRQSLLTIVEEDGTPFAAVLDKEVAHLMSAGPDLLAAARRARDWIGDAMVDNGWPRERVMDPPEGSHLHALNAAIAKAEGAGT